MKRIAARLVLFGLVALLATGCATFNVSQQIWPSDKKASDYVAKVTAAYRDEADDVLVCLVGAWAESPSWAPVEDYSIAFPASAYAGRSAEARELNVYHHKALPVFEVTGHEVRGPCPAPGSEAHAALAPLPVETVGSDRFGSKRFSEMSDEELQSFFESQERRRAVYVILSRPWGFSDHESVDLVYLHDAPIFRGRRAVQIELGPRPLEGRPLWALALPFAVIFDAIALPVYLLFALSYGG